MQNYNWNTMKNLLDHAREATEAEFMTSDPEFIQLENELEMTEDAAFAIIASLNSPDQLLLRNYISTIHKMIYARSVLNYAAGLKDQNDILNRLLTT